MEDTVPLGKFTTYLGYLVKSSEGHKLNGRPLSKKTLEEIMLFSPRIETVAVKDMKLRTFITQDTKRDDLVGHVYDITYGSVKRGKDTLVVIDDSIVRGTTLKQSILKINRL